MIASEKQIEIIKIWDTYAQSNNTVLDTRGREMLQIDQRRYEAIEDIKVILQDFMKDEITLAEFKTDLDSYNKKHNLWGFTATKGQMFFNLLSKSATSPSLPPLLKKSIAEPHDLADALHKIESLETFVQSVFSAAPDKRKVPNPTSIGYFLSYFWQIANPEKWPIMYTSIISSYKALGIWEEKNSQKLNYESFFLLNEEIKSILQKYTGQPIHNWAAEHALWSYAGNPHLVVGAKEKRTSVPTIDVVTDEKEVVHIKANFDKNDFLIPRVAKLVALGEDAEKTASGKGAEYERMVVEIFKQLDFEVQLLGQGKGRNPDAIMTYREDHTAFIVDAKAYAGGYHMGLDDRAIREYINYHCPLLKREGFTKIGFIIVSNGFKSDLSAFIKDITWNTDIKRFLLLSSDALLYLLAYKTKDRLPLTDIIDMLISFNGQITAQDVIGQFEDV
jgi:hypothetical protein